MGAFSSLVLTQLTVPPGDLIYYVVLVFAIASALQSAFNHWRASEFPQARRAFLGLGVLLLAQMTMFAFSGLGWQNLFPFDPTTVLPPMDRAFILFSIIWITWLYAYPEPSRVADGAAALLSLLVVTGLGLSLLLWGSSNPETINYTNSDYNHTASDMLWQIASMLAALIGIGILGIRKPNGMWNGIMLLAIGFLG